MCVLCVCVFVCTCECTCVCMGVCWGEMLKPFHLYRLGGTGNITVQLHY